MASTSSNPNVTEEVEEQCTYPYPSNLSATSFINVNLSGGDNYLMWKTQMLCLLKSHDMFGFINGSLSSPVPTVSGKEKFSDYEARLLLWRRSDALVKGWILGSLSEQTLGYVLNRLTKKLDEKIDPDFCAKDIWDLLETFCAPAPIQAIDGPANLQEVTVADRQREETAIAHHRLYEGVLREDYSLLIEMNPVSADELTESITNNGNTALHVAVGTTKNLEWLKTLLRRVPPNKRLSEMLNLHGSTVLHVAAIVGNTEAARTLLLLDRELLFIIDKQKQSPLALALSNMHSETAKLLLESMKDANEAENDKVFSGINDHGILPMVISTKDFRLAHELLQCHRKLDSEAVLMAIAQSFPSELSMSEEYIVFNRLRSLEDILKMIFGIRKVLVMMLHKIMCIWMYDTRPFIEKGLQSHEDASKLLVNVCSLIKANIDCTKYEEYYMNPIFEAVRQNSSEVVQKIVDHFPNAILSANEDGHNIIQYAVKTRSENVYNLLYQMSEHKNVYRTIRDSHENNLLHLAARLAPTNKLNRISGAALQIQHELHWFKEVEGFVCPLNIIEKNSFDETPQMVFTREHKDLVIEGEKWMKATAESYTITAALITTVVFAAAITVPGGSNQDTGIPIFSDRTAFRIFAISNAISLFSALISLSMFLSILTTRFAQHDFLFKLPTKLIIGLATLFISTSTMVIAFAATLYLVFGQSNLAIVIIPMTVLAFLSIISFVSLQLRLIVDLLSATYGASIFGKKRDTRFY